MPNVIRMRAAPLRFGRCTPNNMETPKQATQNACQNNLASEIVAPGADNLPFVQAHQLPTDTARPHLAVSHFINRLSLRFRDLFQIQNPKALPSLLPRDRFERFGPRWRSRVVGFW